MSKTERTQLKVRVPASLHNELRAEAEHRGLTLNDLIERRLRQEDLQDVRERLRGRIVSLVATIVGEMVAAGSKAGAASTDEILDKPEFYAAAERAAVALLKKFRPEVAPRLYYRPQIDPPERLMEMLEQAREAPSKLAGDAKVWRLEVGDEK